MKSLSHVRLLATPWTLAYQAPPSMGFSRQEYWSGVPSPSPAKAFFKGLSFLEVKHEKYLSHSPAQRVSTPTCACTCLPHPHLFPSQGSGVHPLTGLFGRDSLDSQKWSLFLHQLHQPWLRPPQVVLDPGAEGRAEEKRIPRHSKTNAQGKRCTRPYLQNRVQM